MISEVKEAVGKLEAKIQNMEQNFFAKEMGSLKKNYKEFKWRRCLVIWQYTTDITINKQDNEE